MQTISPSEFHLLKQEIETMGELLSSEKLERKADIDRLTLQIEALKRTFGKFFPGFEEQYAKDYEETLRAA